MYDEKKKKSTIQILQFNLTNQIHIKINEQKKVKEKKMNKSKISLNQDTKH